MKKTHEEAMQDYMEASDEVYTAFVADVVAGMAEEAVQVFGRLDVVLRERPLGKVRERLDALAEAYSALVDEIMVEARPYMEEAQ